MFKEVKPPSLFLRLLENPRFVHHFRVGWLNPLRFLCFVEYFCLANESRASHYMPLLFIPLFFHSPVRSLLHNASTAALDAVLSVVLPWMLLFCSQFISVSLC